MTLDKLYINISLLMRTKHISTYLSALSTQFQDTGHIIIISSQSEIKF